VATNLASPKPGSVSDVKASWIVPDLTCDWRSSYSSIWAGIDGYQSATVEQIGTESDCYHGQASNFAWFEIYPGDIVPLNFSVRVGDHISAEVKYLGSDQFKLIIQDETRLFQTIQLVSANRSSAEWIVEAPSYYNYVLPLANFVDARISHAQATINGHAGTPIDKAWQNDPLTMVTWYGAIKAYPSSVGSNGSFDVAWSHR
jgi:Peptidase A4 family